MSTVARFARGVLTAAVSAACLLLVTSVLVSGETSWTIRFVLLSLIVLSAWRPSVGLLAFIAALPLALAGEVLAGAPPNAAMLTESLVFAFLCGAAWRVAAPASDVRTRCAPAALVLGTIVVASALVELVSLQTAQPTRPIATDLWRHVFFDHGLRERAFAELHENIRWLGALTLAVFIERVLRRWPDTIPRAIRLWLVAGTAAGSFALLRIAQIFLEGRVGGSRDAFMRILTDLRISALHPDLNAAGSYFVLLLVPALMIGIGRRRLGILLVTLPVVLVAFTVAKSRAAIGSLILTLGAVSIGPLLRRRAWVAVAVIAALVAATSFFWASTRRSNVDVETAMSIRTDMTRAAVRMTREHPMFGVGLGHYLPASRRFITRDLPALHLYAPRGENAHNNFLQLMVELGIPALVTFLWLVLPLAWPWASGRGAPPALEIEARAIGAGLMAFLLTALFGHPLLIPQVLFAFFLVIGISAALVPASADGIGRRIVAPALVAFIVATLPLRFFY